MATETRERITDPERLSRLEGAHLHMATKADIAALETRLVAMLAESDEKRAESEARVMARIAESDEKRAESEIRVMARIAETNQKIAETNERIAESNSRLIRWGIGIAVTAFAAAASLIAAGFVLLYRLLAS